MIRFSGNKRNIQNCIKPALNAYNNISENINLMLNNIVLYRVLLTNQHSDIILRLL